MPGQLFAVMVLGIVEGLTEFIPVSSTGHLILVGSLMRFQDEFGTLFEVVIQLGVILAVCVYSAPKLLSVALALPWNPQARRFVAILALAFLPSASSVSLCTASSRGCCIAIGIAMATVLIR